MSFGELSSVARVADGIAGYAKIVTAGGIVMELGTSRHGLVRAANAGSYFRTFVIAGICAVLLTRGYLAATGYPQVGGRSLHIAHVLWGGLFMTAGLAVVLIHVGSAPRRWAAVISGIGFGLFIDEVGKMVTRDTDYFYRPAAGIIYFVFATLVILTQWVDGRKELTPMERTVNGLYVAIDGVASGLTATRRRAAIGLLEHSGHETNDAIVRVLELVPARDEPSSRLLAGLAHVKAGFGRLMNQRWAVVIVVIYLAGQGAATLLFWALAVVTGNTGELTSDKAQPAAVAAWAACALATAALSVWGAVRLRRNRLVAFRYFYAALLTDLLIGQVFEFTLSQFSAVTGLVVDLLILGVMSAELRRLRLVRSQIAAESDGIENLRGSADSATEEVTHSQARVPELATPLPKIVNCLRQALALDLVSPSARRTVGFPP